MWGRANMRGKYATGRGEVAVVMRMYIDVMGVGARVSFSTNLAGLFSHREVPLCS